MKTTDNILLQLTEDPQYGVEYAALPRLVVGSPKLVKPQAERLAGVQQSCVHSKGWGKFKVKATPLVLTS